MPQATKIDWVQAQKFYISNPTVSYKQVAEQYGVGVAAVERRAKKEGWVERRNRVGEEVITAVEGEIVEQNKDRNEVHALGARNLQGLIQKKMALAFAKMEELEKKQEDGVLSPYEKGIISDKGLSELANAYVAAVNLERVTLGIPTSVERKEITGSGGTDLFGTGNKEAFIGIMAGMAVELTDGETAPSVPKDDSGGAGES